MTFIELFQALQDAQVDYVLVGGLAVNLHGVDRSTFDIDLVLAMDPANLRRFTGMALKHGLVPNIPVPLEALESPEQIERWHHEKGMLAFSLRIPGANTYAIDVLVKPVVSYEKMVADAVNAHLLGHPIRVASREHLIEMKTAAGRSKDLQDIEQLRQQLAGDKNEGKTE